MHSSCHGIESIVSHLGHKVATSRQRIGSADQYSWFPERPRDWLQSEAVSGNEGRAGKRRDFYQNLGVRAG